MFMIHGGSSLKPNVIHGTDKKKWGENNEVINSRQHLLHILPHSVLIQVYWEEGRLNAAGKGSSGKVILKTFNTPSYFDPSG